MIVQVHAVYKQRQLRRLNEIYAPQHRKLAEPPPAPPAMRESAPALTQFRLGQSYAGTRRP